MKDQDMFQKTFDKLHASPDLLTEVLNMTEENKFVSSKKKRHIHRYVAAAIAAFVIIGTGGAVYAMDIGGIQRIIQVWVHGDQTNAVFTIEDGSYTLEYEESNGDTVSQSGGGVAFDSDGTERPLTEEELLEELNAPEVEYKDDGSVWVYYLDQKLDITDKFENDFCYVKLDSGGQTLYITIKYQDSYAISPHSYIQPDMFQ